MTRKFKANLLEFLNLYRSWVGNFPNTVLRPEHYQPVQHTLRNNNLYPFTFSTIQSNTQTFQSYKIVVFFGSIVYKEHLCLNTKDKVNRHQCAQKSFIWERIKSVLATSGQKTNKTKQKMLILSRSFNINAERVE